MEKSLYVEKIRKFNRYYANVLGKIDQEIYNKPFPLTEARVITEINFRNGCTSTQVIENLGVDRGQMSRIVQKFEEEKIIFKKQASDDKRQYLLYLTDYGKDIYNGLVENANREVGNMIQEISNRNLTKLINSMETIETIFTKKYPFQDEVSIRPFQSGDVGYVAQLHGEFYGDHHGFFQIFEFYVMKGLTEFVYKSSGGQLWIAEVNGERAGSIAIVQDDDNTAQLRWFIIDDRYQGLGIGTKLLETALNYCKEHNYKHIYLWTIRMLHTARHLYAKYGFTMTEEKENNEWCSEKLIEERWDFERSDEK